jgi:Holliday junction resolvase YEN1
MKQVLKCFGIPYQLAPAEAEAECAKMQRLGVADAVWSGDADALMFGCDLLISDHRNAKEHGDQSRSKGRTEKSQTHVRGIRAQKMKKELALDREGLVLFAILASGDHHPGLSDCGTGLALRAVREGTLARELCECHNQLDCTKWRVKLIVFLHNYPLAKGIVVPPDFPQYNVLKQ